MFVFQLKDKKMQKLETRSFSFPKAEYSINHEQFWFDAVKSFCAVSQRNRTSSVACCRYSNSCKESVRFSYRYGNFLPSSAWKIHSLCALCAPLITDMVTSTGIVCKEHDSVVSPATFGKLQNIVGITPFFYVYCITFLRIYINSEDFCEVLIWWITLHSVLRMKYDAF